MAQYTLAEAAKACGKSKSTVLRSIRAGRLSAVRDALSGGWLVEPVELHRLYPAPADAERGAVHDTPRNGLDAGETVELRARLQDAHETIRDLRTRLDAADRRLEAEAEERRRLTALLADHSERRRSWWRWGRAQS